MFEYELKRSRRKTISVSVEPDNRIVVHCSMRMPVCEVEKFLNKHSNWIKAKMRSHNEVNSENDDIINMKKILIFGKKFDLIFSDRNYIDENAVYIKDIKYIKNLYVEKFKDDFMELFNRFATMGKFSYGDVSFKAYKSRWGCCDRRGNIIVNFKLLMLDKDLIRYVIVHELCHTVYFDHSKNFWVLVERFCPDYKALRKKLKSFSFVINAYQ